jgi:hypothetical protein
MILIEINLLFVKLQDPKNQHFPKKQQQDPIALVPIPVAGRGLVYRATQIALRSQAEGPCASLCGLKKHCN